MIQQIANAIAGRSAVERLEAKRADALADLEASRARYRQACLDAEADEDPKVAKRKATASDELAKAEARVREIDAAIQAAKEREAVAARDAAAAERARRWHLAEEHAEARAKAAADAEKAIAALAEAYGRMVQAGLDLRTACPTRIGDDGALLLPNDAELLLRLHLLKSGFKWASNWPWGEQSIPTLTSRIGEANAYVAHVRRQG